MYNRKSENTHVRTFGSPGFSSLTLSLYKLNLILKFVPYIGRDHRGFDQYCKRTFLSTSVNYEGAAALHQTAMSMISGKDSDKALQLVLPCSNNAALTLESKPDENNQMAAYLVINKNNETIPFRFQTVPFLVYEDGRWVTKAIQAGLGAFAKALNGYLKGIGASNHLNKLSDEELDPERTPAPMG